MNYIGARTDVRPRFRCGCLMRPPEYGSTAELCLKCAEQRKENARRFAPVDILIPVVSTGQVIRYSIPKHVQKRKRR